MGAFVDTMTKNEHQILDRLFCRFVYSSHLAHSVVENEHAVNFLNRIRPGWTIPSRYKISNKMLDGEYDFIKELTINKINESYSLGNYYIKLNYNCN